MRIALLDGYISILHGLITDDYQALNNVITCEAIMNFATQMFQYMEIMVQSTHLAFPTELLKSLFELYIDLVTIFTEIENNPLAKHGNSA